MKKEYVKDNGKVRNCPDNVAKMSVFEYVRYFGFDYSINFKQIALAFITLLSLLLMPLYPVIVLFQIRKHITNTRKNLIKRPTPRKE